MPPQQTDKIPVACFAPPLTDQMFAEYAKLAGAADPEIRDAMTVCLDCVKAWWELPESKRTGSLFRVLHGGKPTDVEVRPLEVEHVEALNQTTPWPRELDSIQVLFDGIPTDSRELRNAAFHLLWYAREIALDREPITMDRVK